MVGRVWGRTCGMPVSAASHILGSCQPGVPQVCSRPLPFLPPKGELGLVGQPEDCRQSGRLCCCHPPRALVTHPLPTPRPVQVPLFHCFGMVMGSLACTTHGATMVLPSECFDAEVRCAAPALRRQACPHLRCRARGVACVRHAYRGSQPASWIRGSTSTIKICNTSL